MQIRPPTILLASLAILGYGAAPQAQVAGDGPSAGPAARPNVLLIIGDDFGIDVTSDVYPGLIDGLVERYGPAGLGHPGYRQIDGHPASTPTIAGLARQGMRFTNAWAHPFCSPTRAAIITGLFAVGTRVANYRDPLAQNHETFVRRLRDEAGYRTGIFGKWHLAGLPGDPVSYPGMKPKEAGFDLFRGNMHAAILTFWDYDYQIQDGDTPADQWRTEPAPERSLPGIAPTTYAPVVKVADTIEWISAAEREDPDRPWLAWFAFNLSHATIQREPSQMAVPDIDTLDAVSRAEMEACGGQFGSANVGECSGEALMRAMTNSMDMVTGKLLEAVDALDSNTYVIFIGDNGTPMYGRPGLDFIDNMYLSRSGRGKGTAYESGARVPLVIRGPGIVPGSSSDEFTHAADLYSTILELAGLDVPRDVAAAAAGATAPLDSVSLAPVLHGTAAAIRDPATGYVLTETENLMTGGTRQVGARNATHKVVCIDDAGNCEFFDLSSDPLEEYPLMRPESCGDYGAGRWSPADPRWHYCRLTEVVATRSFL